MVENASIDYGGVVIACTTEGVYALENYKNNTLLQHIGWGSINIPCNISNGKVLAHMGFTSKVLPGLFTALSLRGFLHLKLSAVYQMSTSI